MLDHFNPNLTSGNFISLLLKWSGQIQTAKAGFPTPVTWTEFTIFLKTKTAATTYFDVHIGALCNQGWHLFKGGISICLVSLI